jgi:hypothetical protein
MLANKDTSFRLHDTIECYDGSEIYRGLLKLRLMCVVFEMFEEICGNSLGHSLELSEECLADRSIRTTESTFMIMHNEDALRLLLH